ncbi:hypothetical protein PC116_g30427 [Phytophthora cactorum]|nr:hypothetical protein PC116_g30427 [Phytophthora cactorum]
MRRLALITAADVVDLAGVIGTAVDQAHQVVGMTRATAVAHMMIDQADIVTEADSATAIAEAVPISNLSVADESIATTTGRETTRAGNGVTKERMRIPESYDATKPDQSYRDKSRFVLVGIFCLPYFCIHANKHPDFSFCL